jgi:putative FmdB family regulatory protein
MAGLQVLGNIFWFKSKHLTRQEKPNGGKMPLYDFKCEQCSNTFELSLSFENKDLQYCEDCEKPLVRIYTPVGAIFKGTGWGSKP